MLSSNEVELRILATLEEAGEENITGLMNTVTLPWPSKEIKATFLEALRALIRKDFVRLSVSRTTQLRLAELSIDGSLQETDLQDNKLAFDEKRALWTDPSRKGPPFPEPFPYVITTELGKVRSRDVLVSRGYQWWAPHV